MLVSLTRSVEERTTVLEKFLSLYDACDEAAAHPNEALYLELSARSALGSNLARERVFRHSAVVTQLYCIYESFAETILDFWLARLPRYRLFTDLRPTFQNAYRFGIARIIQDAGMHRYRHLSLLDVVEKYVIALRGESAWEFVSDALTSHEKNLRYSEFVKLFHSAGLEGVWSSLEQNPLLISFTVEGDPERSLEQMIQDLVTFRNDAAHGDPDDILGTDTLREWIAFVRAFCHALVEFITHRIVWEEARHIPESVLGLVTETFRDNIVVATCDHGTLHVGDQLFFLRETDCVTARIDSLQVNGVDHTVVEIACEGFEVGIRSSVKVPRNSRLLRIDDLH